MRCANHSCDKLLPATVGYCPYCGRATPFANLTRRGGGDAWRYTMLIGIAGVIVTGAYMLSSGALAGSVPAAPPIATAPADLIAQADATATTTRGPLGAPVPTTVAAAPAPPQPASTSRALAPAAPTSTVEPLVAIEAPWGARDWTTVITLLQPWQARGDSVLLDKLYAAYINRATAAQERNDFSSAVSDFNAALRLRPSGGEAKVGLELAGRRLEASRYPAVRTVDELGKASVKVASVDVPGSVNRGGTIVVKLRVANESSRIAKVGIGMSIKRTGDQRWLDDTADDVVDQAIYPGISELVRRFRVGQDAAPGSYDVWLSLHDGRFPAPGVNTLYDNLGPQSGSIRVQ